MPESIIKTKVLFVNEQEKVDSVVKQMIKQNVSSCLVSDNSKKIIGILTERDIVHKFTLLETKDKLKANVNTVMTRPVKFISLDNLFADIEKLHYKSGHRHFPISSSPSPSEKNILGMITVTDLFRQHVAESNRILKGNKPKKIFIVAENSQSRASYKKLFNSIGFEANVFAPSKTIIKDILDTRRPFIFDLETNDAIAMAEFIKMAKDHKGELFLVSEDSRILPAYRNHLDSSHQHITIKPLDITYMKWLLDGAIAGED